MSVEERFSLNGRLITQKKLARTLAAGEFANSSAAALHFRLFNSVCLFFYSSLKRLL
jgi:hypothetical protein